MPIYEYRALAACANAEPCNGQIEVFAKMADADLTHCPRCGVAIERVISAPASAMGSGHLLQEKNFAAKGFTQYRKAGGGVYEKTAGDGPQFISGNN
jgi:putative FmdB family regulatory protein